MHVLGVCPTHKNLTYMDGIMLSQVIVTAHKEKSRPPTHYAVGRHKVNLAVQAAESIVKHSFSLVPTVPYHDTTAKLAGQNWFAACIKIVQRVDRHCTLLKPC